MSKEQKKRIHEQSKLCGHILGHVAESGVALHIGHSSIAGAGSGLFTVDNIPAGTDIFRSQPLLIVGEAVHDGVCDWCLLNRNSSVHPDGRFYTSGDTKPEITPCSRCKVTKYCSKECQAKAWKSYHKYECALLKEDSGITSLDQVLCRLLLWMKKKAISEDDIRVITALETNFEARKDQLREAHNAEPGISQTLAVATNFQLKTKSNLDLSVIQRLYCAIETNAFTIRPPEIEVAYGMCLDLVVSLINHCCEENAHVFFEGRELRCRALKDIPAGSEITVCYPDVRQDVLCRRRTLKEEFYIVCNCAKCTAEVAEHLSSDFKRFDRLNILRDAQEKLQKLQFTYGNNCKVRNIRIVVEYQNKLLDIEKDVYYGGNWPSHMEPMPKALRTLGIMFLDLNYIVGLEFILKGTLYTRHHSGSSWVIELMHVVKELVFIAQSNDDDDFKWTGASHPDVLGGRSTLRDVARGYMAIACIGAKLTFGLDTKYVRAFYKMGGDIIERHGDPYIDTDGFMQRFEESQKRLLAWANMEAGRGLKLPSHQVILDLKKDCEAVRTGGADAVIPHPLAPDENSEQGSDLAHTGN